MKVCVTGAGGFIGSHLVKRLKGRGHWVRGVDLKAPLWEDSWADELIIGDLRDYGTAKAAVFECEHVYALAADMGGMGYLTGRGMVLSDNLRISHNTMLAAGASEATTRLLYASSACIYPEELQTEAEVTPLKESDAYPANPDLEYGWEKLISERLANVFRCEGLVDTRVVRFHNIFGPLGSFEGGREKAPAAMCRKVAEAQLAGEHSIEVWGDGEQTRSFLYIDDALDGIELLMASDHTEPINIGSDHMVTINELARIVAKAAGWEVQLGHVEGPQGVRGRNSDNAQARKVLGFHPRVPLEEGLANTYLWIYRLLKKRRRKVTRPDELDRQMRADDMVVEVITNPDSALTDTAAAKVFLKIEDTAEDTRIGDLVTRVSSLVSQECSRRFALTTHTDEYHNGNGTPDLWLRHWPVATWSTDTDSLYLDATRVWSASTSLAEYTASNTAGEFLVPTDEEGKGRVERTNGVWSSGRRNIKVTYRAGYTTIPDPIVQATLRWIGAMWAVIKGGLHATKSESLAVGGGSLTIVEHNIPGDVKRILDRWKRVAW